MMTQGVEAFELGLGAVATSVVVAFTAVRALASRLGPFEAYGRSVTTWLQIATVGTGAAIGWFIAGIPTLGWLILGASVLCASCAVAALRQGPQGTEQGRSQPGDS